MYRHIDRADQPENRRDLRRTAFPAGGLGQRDIAGNRGTRAPACWSAGRPIPPCPPGRGGPRSNLWQGRLHRTPFPAPQSPARRARPADVSSISSMALEIAIPAHPPMPSHAAGTWMNGMRTVVAHQPVGRHHQQAPADRADRQRKPAPEEQRHQPLRQGEENGWGWRKCCISVRSGGLVALHPAGQDCNSCKGRIVPCVLRLAPSQIRPDKVLGIRIGDHIGRGAGRVAFLPDCLEPSGESGQAACGPR